jgi:hypothetical protein
MHLIADSGVTHIALQQLKDCTTATLPDFVQWIKCTPCMLPLSYYRLLDPFSHSFTNVYHELLYTEFEEEQINASYTDGQQTHDRTKCTTQHATSALLTQLT